jgi:hypothetical protein
VDGVREGTAERGLVAHVSHCWILAASLMRSIPLRMVPFDAAIVIRRTAKANGPRARETAIAFTSSCPGRRHRLGLSVCKFESSFAAASPQFVGAEAGARPLDRLGGGVECFTTPDAGHRWALGAPRRAQSVERMETDRVAVRAEIFDKRSARQVLAIIWLGHCTFPSQQIVETCGKVRLICM